MTASGIVCLLLAAPSAHAGLGGSPMTPPSDASITVRTVQPGARATDASQSPLNAAASAASTGTSTATPYTVRETTLGNGTVVREYLAQNGTVFGIAWQGPQMPDLAQLLDGYFPQYVAGVQAVHAQRGVRGPVALDGAGLVVHSSGHMGSFAGQAWLPQALPAGVSGSDIQ